MLERHEQFDLIYLHICIINNVSEIENSGMLKNDVRMKMYNLRMKNLKGSRVAFEMKLLLVA